MTPRRALFILAAAVAASRLATLPDYLQNNDGIYFVLGVERYAVPELRPHFPGYPVYIWLGKLFALLLGGAAPGLRAVSLLATIAALWPIAALARSWRRAAGAADAEADRAGFAAALLWAVTPMPWLTGTEIYSDPLGLLLALLTLSLSIRALETSIESGRGPLVGAAALAGTMLGVRLGYVSLLLPLGWAAWRRRREPGLTRAVLLAFAASIGLWAGWQWAMDGPRLLTAASNHLTSHFSTEGISVANDPHPLTRLLVLARTVVLYGFGGFWPRAGAPAIRLLPTACLLSLAVGALPRLWRSRREPAGLLPWLCVVPYVLGLVLSFDVGFPRYSLPLVAFGTVVAGVGIPRGRTLGGLAVAAAGGAIALVSIPLAREHRLVAPLESQLARYAHAHFAADRTLLVASDTDPPSLLLFLRAEGPRLSVARAEAQDAADIVKDFEGRGFVAYATAPLASAPEEWVPVARFCRSHFIDSRSPLELWLFRHDPAAGGVGAVPPCLPPER